MVPPTSKWNIIFFFFFAGWWLWFSFSYFSTWCHVSMCSCVIVFFCHNTRWRISTKHFVLTNIGEFFFFRSFIVDMLSFRCDAIATAAKFILRFFSSYELHIRWFILIGFLFYFVVKTVMNFNSLFSFLIFSCFFVVFLDKKKAVAVREHYLLYTEFVLRIWTDIELNPQWRQTVGGLFAKWH